jgi:carbamoyl-phosphate synthase large subunit
MKKILVTAIGGDIGQSIAQCLRDNEDDVFLIGTDIHNKHGGSQFVNEFHVVASAKSPDYLQTISDIVKQNNIDVIIPVNEDEIKLLINSYLGLKLIHCGKEMVNSGLDKLATIEFLKTLGIEVPWTVSADNEEPYDFPCIMKPRFSSGSRNIFGVNSNAEAKFLSDKYPECVFQEMLEPFEKEITCGLYRTKEGNIRSIQFERLLVGGLTGWAKVVKIKQVENLLNVIAEGCKLKGSINVQLRVTKKGPMVFEINPRFSSTAYMRHKLGFTDVLWSLKEFFDEPIKLSSAEAGTVLVRKQDVMILSKSLN